MDTTTTLNSTLLDLNSTLLELNETLNTSLNELNTSTTLNETLFNTTSSSTYDDGADYFKTYRIITGLSIGILLIGLIACGIRSCMYSRKYYTETISSV